MGAARKANKHLPSNLVFEKRGKKRNEVLRRVEWPTIC